MLLRVVLSSYSKLAYLAVYLSGTLYHHRNPPMAVTIAEEHPVFYVLTHPCTASNLMLAIVFYPIVAHAASWVVCLHPLSGTCCHILSSRHQKFILTTYPGHVKSATFQPFNTPQSTLLHVIYTPQYPIPPSRTSWTSFIAHFCTTYLRYLGYI